MGRHRSRSSTRAMDGTDAEFGTDTSMGDVTDATLPPAVPRNEDGTVQTEGTVSDVQARQIGALNAESAAKNKAMARKLVQKTAGKDIKWGVEDACELFGWLKQAFAGEWGSIVVWTIRIEPAPKASFPPVSASALADGHALYKYIEACHAQSPAATYKVHFRASNAAERGSGYVHMPDRSPVHVYSQHSQSGQQPYPYGQPSQVPQSFSGPPGYWQQAQPQQPPQQRDVIVVQPQQPQAPAQVPLQQTPTYAPAPVPVQPDASQAAVMAVLKEVVETLRKPPPPPGFIPLPENYPVPPGYFPVPGGCIPDPRGVQAHAVASAPVTPSAPVPYAPPFTPVAAAPVTAIVPAAVPVEKQMADTIKTWGNIMKGVDDFRRLFAPPIDDLEPELVPGQSPAKPEPDSPVFVQDVAGYPVTRWKESGKVDWGTTALTSLPKVMETVKSGIGEYNKLMDRQAQRLNELSQQRVRLAQEVQRVQQGMNPAALPQQQVQAPAPPSPAPAPAQQAQAPASAKPPAPPAPSPKRPVGMAIPSGPLFSTQG